jgi:hypothetical protein
MSMAIPRARLVISIRVYESLPIETRGRPSA